MINNSNIYNISGQEDFFSVLASGIIDRVPKSFNTKNVIILLPTQQSCITLNKEFKKLNKNFSKIYSINDLSDLISIETRKTILSQLELSFKISQLILNENLSNFNSISTVTPLSDYIAALIFKLELHQIKIEEIIKIIDENLALHQQELLSIIKFSLQFWCQNSYITKSGWNNILIDSFSKTLNNKMIIIAGISTNIPSITQLIKKVSTIRNNFIVFYGLDNYLDENAWQNISPTHPQYNFKEILRKLDITRNNINIWKQTNNLNFSWLSNALKPARSTDNWHNIKKSKIENWHYINCSDLHNEANIIIETVKKNQDKTVMIVTPDESLIIKLIFALKSNNIAANIIRDYPLSKANCSILLNLSLDYIIDNFSCISALTLLKHKLVNIDPNTLSQIELIIRNNTYTNKNILKLSIEDENFIQFINASEKIKEAFFSQKLNFTEMLKAHIEFIKIITKESLWENIEGEELRKFFDRILELAPNIGSLSIKDYSAFLSYFLKSSYYRKEDIVSNVTLMKPLDSRLHKADLVILAGMNEGIWPSKPTIDPCFNINLLRKIGLPGPENLIGEEAYDFQCLAQAKQVIVTRSNRVDGSLTICSRWLLRVITLAKKMNIDLKASSNFVKPNIPIIENFRTAPIPSSNYRPIKLSVTQIDKLIFNPYHIYVDLILQLKKLPSLEYKMSSLDFGVFIHKALESYNNGGYKSNLFYLLEAGKQVLADLHLNNDQLELIYWSRFVRIAKWFVENETQSNKVFLEIAGRHKLKENFMLTAKADRIEISKDNKVHIIDYKTGNLSSLKSILSGKTLQLILEGVIAKNGGFNFQKSSQELGSLKYIQLSGGEKPIEILEIQSESSDLINFTEEYIKRLIEDYNNPTIPYYYTRKKKQNYCEYAHLARFF